MGGVCGKEGDEEAVVSTSNPGAGAAAAMGAGGVLTLDAVRDENYNTKVFTFSTPDLPPASLPSGTWCLGLTAPIGEGGADHTRMYTPVGTSPSSVDLMIKVYDEGVMSKHVHSMSPGDTVNFVGPKQKLDYKPNMVQELGLLAGGTGITPMLQLIELVLGDPKDTTKVTLLHANRSEKDLLAAERLRELEAGSAGQLRVVDYLSSEGGEGRIDRAAISKHLPSTDAKVCICGPPGLILALQGEGGGGILAELGYTDVFKF